MTDHRASRHDIPVPAGVLLIPGALALVTAATVLLTLRTPGFAVLAGVGVFLASLVATLVLQAFFGRSPGEPPHL